MHKAYLALGSNIDPQSNMEAAAALIKEQWPEATFSHLYRTAPLLHEDQDDFLNAVVRIETKEDVEQIIEKAKRIEIDLGKHTPFPNGPRTIDIDLLLIDDEIQECHPEPDEGPTYQIPHPRMHERRFVLEPLCELIETDGVHPTLNKTWSQLQEEASNQEVEKLSNLRLS